MTSLSFPKEISHDDPLASVDIYNIKMLMIFVLKIIKEPPRQLDN